jgi:hypothetical protein
MTLFSFVFARHSDPVHCLKKARNNMRKSRDRYLDGHGTRRLQIGDKFVTWDMLERLFKQDNHGGIRAMPKLTRDHVYPTAHGAMKVKTALQVLSGAVAHYAERQNELLPTKPLDAFVEYVQQWNDVFDVFNQSKSIKPGPEQEEVLAQVTSFADWMKGWTEGVLGAGMDDAMTKHPALVSWELRYDTQSMCRGFVSCFQHYNARYELNLSPRKFNQDPIENLFSRVRTSSNDRNPSTHKALEVLHQITATRAARASVRGGNCDEGPASRKRKHHVSGRMPAAQMRGLERRLKLAK